MGDNYLQNAYNSIPPVARVWLMGVVAVTFAVKFGLLPLSLVFFTPQAVLVKLQLWRLLSSFFWVGKLELAWLINLFMTGQYFIAYEKDCFPSAGGPGRGNTSDALWTVLLGMLGILLGYGFGLQGYFMGECLPMFVIYLYSKRHPEDKASVWGLPPGGFPAKYLPFVLVAFTVVMQGDPIPPMVGIAVAHTYYYLLVVLAETQGPLKSARLYLATPHLLCRLLGDVPTDRAPNGRQAHTAPPQAPHRFPGQGRPLHGGAAPQGWLQWAGSAAGSAWQACLQGAAAARAAVFPAPAVAPGFHPVRVEEGRTVRAAGGGGRAGSAGGSAAAVATATAAAAAAATAAAAAPVPAPATGSGGVPSSTPAASAQPTVQAAAATAAAAAAAPAPQAAVDEAAEMRQRRLAALAARGML